MKILHSSQNSSPAIPSPQFVTVIFCRAERVEPKLKQKSEWQKTNPCTEPSRRAPMCRSKLLLLNWCARPFKTWHTFCGCTMWSKTSFQGWGTFIPVCCVGGLERRFLDLSRGPSLLWSIIVSLRPCPQPLNITVQQSKCHPTTMHSSSATIFGQGSIDRLIAAARTETSIPNKLQNFWIAGLAIWDMDISCVEAPVCLHCCKSDYLFFCKNPFKVKQHFVKKFHANGIESIQPPKCTAAHLRQQSLKPVTPHRQRWVMFACLDVMARNTSLEY